MEDISAEATQNQRKTTVAEGAACAKSLGQNKLDVLSNRRKDKGEEDKGAHMCDEVEGQGGAEPALTECLPCAGHRPSTSTWVNAFKRQNPTGCMCYCCLHVAMRKPRLQSLRALPEVTQGRVAEATEPH